ncbi:hypothetical protein [Flavobacterium sp. SM2513]|uniref:hypothetical protein n=1 Tax=Flavobacterium sp. SM2513 TaxID=3424766 RepID=UPI003D7F51B5
MARNQSIVRLSGFIDGVTYVETRTGKQSRSRSSLNKAKMNANPKFRKIRMIQKELTGFSKYGALFRLGIRSELRRVKSFMGVQRLNKRMVFIKNLDVTNRLGLRNVATGLLTVEGKNYLKNFDFYGMTTVSALVQRPFALDLSIGEARIDGFDVARDLIAPANCTHVSFKSVMIGLDFDLSVESTTRSSLVTMPLDAPVADLVLKTDTLPTVTTNVFYLVQILFYEEISGFLELTELDSAAFTLLEIEV